jgi:glycosyltransferase involved in cell wall biosynthesis
MLFSIITVALNSEKTIADTLTSVATQNYVDYEHIVVDGSSTDSTLDLVEQNRHARLRWVSEPDQGLYDAMNKGIAMARGDYVLFLNSDDLFCRPDALNIVAEKIMMSGADCIFADVRFVENDGVSPAGRVYSARRFRPALIRVGVMPPHPAMFVRRELLIQLGGFNTKYRMAADFDLIARALLKTKSSFAVLPEIITSFRIGGISTDGLKAKVKLGREFATSLKALGQPMAWFAVQMRYPLKLMQYKVWPFTQNN